MLNTLCLCLAHVFLLQTGNIAYVTGESQATYRLTILDAERGEVSPIGLGNCDAYPQWSPDGSRIAYQSLAQNGPAICIATVETRENILLKHRFEGNYQPAWSPKGDKLAYSSDGDTPPMQALLVYDLATGEEQVWGGDQRGLICPAWLPSTDMLKALNPDDQLAADSLGLFALKEEAEKNGALLAIGAVGAPPKLSTELFVVTREKAIPLLTLLVKDSHRFIRYAVSPDHDGRQIAYESNEGGDREIFMIGRRGIANLSNHHEADWNPQWSPNDDWLAFESFRDGSCGIYRAQVSTANVSRMAGDTEYDCWAPAWSPDGKWIAYVSNQKGIPQIFAARSDGGDARQLTDGPHPAYHPVWQPKPPKDKE